jgi:hypothetical protein
MIARLLVLIAVGLASTPQQADAPHAPDTPEPQSAELIAKYTTEPRFVSPWVSYVPESSSVPSPTDYLKRIIGTPGELTRTSQIYGYFGELDRASARVQVTTIGQTEEGRDIVLVAIADEPGIRDLERLKQATTALADPRRTPPERAEALIRTSRPIYYFNAGLHSTELGPPEMVMELAYRLAVSDQPFIDRIRKNLVVLINPVAEPDGRDKAVDWFYRYLKGKTDYDALPPRTPPYWGHYVFHDNNRDSHQKALKITQAVHRMFFDYHPTVVHDLHESIPLLQTWNGTGPFNTNLDPILINEWFETSFAEIRALSSMGMPGVWTWGFGEGWGHHYLESVAVNHNALGRGYETFGNGTAETVERTIAESKDIAGRPVTSREWYRPWPPDRKFRWSMRNNTNYMQTGCLAILDYSARNAEHLLRNFYRKGYNSWQKGLNDTPRAIAIPSGQGDPRRVAEMVNLLRSQGIEVSTARAAFSAGSRSYPAGTYLVPLDQPYRNYAVDLLLPQEFPPDTTFTPYDDVSWALPVHYGVEAVAIDDQKIGEVPREPIGSDVNPSGRVEGTGPVFLLRDTGQESLLAARARLGQAEVAIARRAFSSGGSEFPAGSWIVRTDGPTRATLDAVARELGLDFLGGALPDVPRHDAPLPRLAVWHTWADTESVGWIRYALDREEIPYAYIRDEDVRAGNLRARYDVIVFGHTDSNLQTQIHGIDRRWGPLAYSKTSEFPSHGVPDSSDDITGGIGWPGMQHLEQFVRDGGLLITLGNGSALALESGLIRGVSRSSGPTTPGAELRATFAQPEHPIAYGYPKVTSVFRSQFPVYDVRRADRRAAVLSWGTRPRAADREPDEKVAKEEQPKGQELVVSGGVKNGDDLEGRPAILDFTVGRGHVIAFNFNPIHRELNRSDYRLLWNAILNWRGILGDSGS